MEIKKCFILSMTIFFMQPLFAITTQNQTQIIKPYSMVSYDKTLSAIIAKNKNISFDQKLSLEANHFLGKPYVDGSLGEGANAPFDQNPLYRTNQFDCQTFVETMLALIHAQNLAEFQKNIINIRYQQGKIAFLDRQHFVNPDWNLQNEKNGFTKDITQAVFKDVAVKSVTYLNKPNWFANLPASRLQLLKPISANNESLLLKKLHGLSRQIKPETSTIYYIPLTALYSKYGTPNMKLFNRIPNNSVIEIVRPNWNLNQLIGTNLDVSHMGFGIYKKGQLLFLNASMLQHKVVEQSLVNYLQSYLNSSTVKGIHVEEII